jgi:hypothetical protein
MDETSTEWPRATLRHLRSDDFNCARRIALEMEPGRDRAKPNWGAKSGFELANRIQSDATNAHAELRGATAADFPRPSDLTPEEQAVYGAAAAGYVALFPEPVVHDDTGNEWETPVPALEIRFVGRAGIPCRDAAGTAHLRVLQVDARAPQLSPSQLHFLALRTEGWADEVVVDVAALLAAERRAPVAITGAVRADARSWAEARLTLLRSRLAAAAPRMGRDCLGCPFVAGCPVHR